MLTPDPEQVDGLIPDPDSLPQGTPSTPAATRVAAAKLALVRKVAGADAVKEYKTGLDFLASAPPDVQDQIVEEAARSTARDEAYRRIREVPLPAALPFPSRSAASPAAGTPDTADADWYSSLATLTEQVAAVTGSSNATSKLLETAAPPATEMERMSAVHQAADEFLYNQAIISGFDVETGDYVSTAQKWGDLAKSMLVPGQQAIFNNGVPMNSFLREMKKLPVEERLTPENKKRFDELNSGVNGSLRMQNALDFVDAGTNTGSLALEGLDLLFFLPARGAKAAKAAEAGPGFNTQWTPEDWAAARGFASRKRGGNAVAVMGERGAKAEAGRLNAIALTSDEVAERVGTTRDDARTTADPFEPFARNPDNYTGLSPETVEAIEEAKKGIERQFSDATGMLPDRGPLSIPEQEQVIRDKMQKIPRSVRVASRDERGFTLAYDDGTVSQRFTFQLDSVGGVEGVVDTSILATKALSPSARLKGEALRNVNTASMVENEAEALGYEFKKILDKAMENTIASRMTGLSTPEWEGVDQVLIQGDRLSRPFTARELISGVRVEGVGVVPLSERQAAKYFEIRHIYDQLHRVRDDIYVRDLEARGFRSVTSTLNGQRVKLAVRQPSFVRTGADGTTSVAIPADLKRVLTIKGGKIVAIEVNAKMAGSTTNFFGRLDKPVKIGDEFFEYGYFKSGDLADVGPGMLGYRNGYVPLYSRQVNYVARETATVLYNGSPRKVKQVRSFFDTKEDADAFMAGKPDTWELTLDKELRASQAADGEEYRQAVEEAAFNGTYFHTRGEPIPYGSAQVETPRYGALDSLNRYTRAMAWAYPQTAFRQRTVTQFLNQFREFLLDPTDWRSDLKPTANLSVAERNAILQYREDLKSWLSIRTEDESMLANLAEHLSQYTEGKLTGKSREKIRNAGKSDLAGELKGLTHHLTLGLFEPGQLLVQAAGLSTAVALDPIHGAKALRLFPLLRVTAYLHPSHPKYEALVKYVGKLTGVEEGEAFEMVKAFRESGLARSLRNGNADYNAAEDGLITSKAVLSRIADKGLVLYREGEFVNRAVSFAVAWERVKTASKTKMVTDRSKLTQVVDEYYRVAYNMQRANQAQFQKGWGGVPTQYMNIMFKYLEHIVPALIGKEGAQWSRKDALQVIGISTLMFGVVGGIPFGKAFSTSVRNWVTGKPEDGGLGVEDENAAVAVEGGLADLSLSWAFGVPVSVSERVGLAGSVFQTWERFGDDPTASELLLGASFGSGNRILETSSMAGRLMSPVVNGEEAMTGERFALVLDELGRAARSWDNYHKARLWYANKEITDRRGNVTAQLAEGDGQYGFLSNPTTAAKFLGFSTKELDWARELANEKRNARQDIEESLDAMRQITLRIVTGGELKEDQLQQYETFYNSIYNALDPADREQFANQWRRELAREDKLSRDLRDLVDREVSSGVRDPNLQSNPLYSNPQQPE